MQPVKITCNSELQLPLDELHPIQGELKILTAENYEKLKKSILDVGFKFPMFVWKEVTTIAARILGGRPTTTLKWWILDGHGRHRVLTKMRELGHEVPLLPCVEITASSMEEAKKMVLLISSNFHTMTKEGLYEYLETSGIDSSFLDEVSFDEIDMQEFKEEFYEEPKISDTSGEDDIPEVKNAITRSGDLWTMGNHRLLCGDSTDRSQVERLMDGEKADMVFTDPPYNVGFKYGEYDDTEITQDKWVKICRGWYESWKLLSDRIVLTPGCNNLELWCRMANPTHIAPWIKTNGQTTGRVTHFWHWEPIFFFGKFERKRANDIFEHYVNSGFLRDSAESPVHKGQHPCPKPLALWTDIIENFSDTDDNIFDPFLGSGSTLIACEKTNRRCFGMEIDPHYCDVILTRWAKFTGKDPVREDGKTWSSLCSG